MKRFFVPSLIALTALAALGILGAYIKNWTLAFNSDYAMIGLMAKRMLSTGEVPLFVGRVGYQGVLLEVPAVALAFKIFGIHSYSLNLAPSLFFCILVFLFYRTVRLSLGSRVAALASLCFVVSTPHLYNQVARTQPNYVETFAFGMILFWIYTSLLQSHFRREKAFLPPDYFKIALAGLVFGFALYTYAQIYFFVIAILLHASVLYLRSLRHEFFQKNSSWKEILLPSEGIVAKILIGAGVFVLLAWSYMAWIDVYQFRGRVKILTSPLANFAVLLVIYALCHLASFAKKHFQFLLRQWKTGACFGAAFLIGYSPKIYYNKVLGLRSISRTGVSGDFSDLWRRLVFAFQGNRRFLNIDSNHLFDALVGACLFACFVCFLIHYAKIVWQIIFEKKDSSHLETIPVFAFLPPTILSVFVLSSSIVDLHSARYTLALWLFYPVALAWFVCRVVDSASIQNFKKVFVCSLLAIILGNNAYAFYRTVREAPEKSGFEDTIAYLESKGLHYAYGDYWQAYAITWLSKEKIIVEPLDANYIVDYEAIVANADEVAYIDKEPYRLPIESSVIGIRGHSYEVLSKAVIHGVSIFHLKRTPMK